MAFLSTEFRPLRFCVLLAVALLLFKVAIVLPRVLHERKWGRFQEGMSITGVKNVLGEPEAVYETEGCTEVRYLYGKESVTFIFVGGSLVDSRYSGGKGAFFAPKPAAFLHRDRIVEHVRQ